MLSFDDDFTAARTEADSARAGDHPRARRGRHFVASPVQ